MQEIKDHKNCIDARVCGTIACVEFRLKNQAYISQFAEQFTSESLKEGVFFATSWKYCVYPSSLLHKQ